MSGDAPRLDEVAVFILAGGEGSRLREAWTGPKALATVEGKPFVGYVIDALERAGFERIVLLTGRGAGDVEEALAGRAVSFLPEASPLGTGGALRAAAPLARPWNLILNGDSYCEPSWTAFLAASAARAERASLMACRVGDTSSYGAVDVDGDGRVTAFHEKGRAGAGLVNAGAYFARESFFHVDLSEDSGDDPLSLENVVLPAMAAARALGAWTTSDGFWDIGTPDRLEAFRNKIRGESAG